METGSQTNIPFSGDKYESVYECMKALMEKLEGNTYHRRKFNSLIKSIAQQGRLVIITHISYYFLLSLVIECSAQRSEAGLLLICLMLD